MSKVLILGDTHWGIRNDSEIFSDFFLRFYNDVLFPYIKKHNITQIIQTGDLMDKRKGVNYRTLSIVTNDFMMKLKELGCTLHLIPGNHDIYYRNSNEINSMSELFMWMDHVKIYNEPTTVDFDSMKLDFIPWMNKYNTENILKFMKKSESQACVGHFEIAGFEMYSGVESSGGLLVDLFAQYEVTISGHYHHRSTSGNITYVGTPYEMTWIDYNDPKGFHILDTETRDLTFVENPYRMFHKAFYSSKVDYTEFDFSVFADSIVKVIVQDKDDNNKYESFLDSINSHNPVDLTIVDSDITVLHGVDEEKLEALDTFSVLIDSAKLTAIHEGLDADRMSKLIQELYHDAITEGRDK